MKKVLTLGLLTKTMGKWATKIIFKATLIAMALIVGLAVFTRFILEILFSGLFG